jgi:hypothetical protein
VRLFNSKQSGLTTIKDDIEQANKPRKNMERPKEGERGGKKKKDSEARMARRAIAAETLKLIQEGTFRHLDIAEAQAEAENSSLLFTPISCEQRPHLELAVDCLPMEFPTLSALTLQVPKTLAEDS